MQLTIHLGAGTREVFATLGRTRVYHDLAKDDLGSRDGKLNLSPEGKAVVRQVTGMFRASQRIAERKSKRVAN
jgi:hypothetical protein